MFILLTLIAAIISILNPNIAWILIIMPGLYIVYATFIALIQQPLKLRNGIDLTQYEKEIAKKYSAYLQAPIAAPAVARGLSAIGLILLITGAVFIFRSYVIESIVAAVGGLYIFFAPVISRLNPSASIVAHAQKGNVEAAREVKALQSIKEKANSK